MKLQTKKNACSSYNLLQYNTSRCASRPDHSVCSSSPRIEAQNMLLVFHAMHLDNYQSASSFLRVQPAGIASCDALLLEQPIGQTLSGARYS